MRDEEVLFRTEPELMALGVVSFNESYTFFFTRKEIVYQDDS